MLFLALCDNMRVNYGSLEKAGQMLDRLQSLNLVQIAMKLDPVGSTVRYEMMKLCNGSVVVGNL